MSQLEVKIDYEQLKRALKRNPSVVRDEVNTFLVRASALIKQGIAQSPWRIGGSGGGVPISTGNLKKAHQYRLEPFRFIAEVNQRKAEYAGYVHYGTKFMEARPWLEYVKQSKEKAINDNAKILLERITADLAK